MPQASHPVRDAGLAISLLTVVPTSATLPEGESTQVAAWFPWVGGLFGVVGYGLAKVAGLIGAEQHAPFLAGAIIALVWALGSRLLHYDGLADVADAFWGSEDRERRLEIMSDSHTGAFGASAVAFAALVEAIAIGTILSHPHELPFLVVPVISRFAATASCWLGTPAKPGGLGRSVMGRPTGLSVVIGLVPVMAAFAAIWLGFHYKASRSQHSDSCSRWACRTSSASASRA